MVEDRKRTREEPEEPLQQFKEERKEKEKEEEAEPPKEDKGKGKEKVLDYTDFSMAATEGDLGQPEQATPPTWKFAPATTKYVVYTRSDPTLAGSFAKPGCSVMRLADYQANEGESISEEKRIPT